MKLFVAASMLPLVLGAAILGGACDAGVVHPFGAFAYNMARGCLESAGAVDVIDGPDPGSCPGAHCWVTPAGNIYISDQACDHPLDYTEGFSGPCAQALAAYKTRKMCSTASGGAGGAGGAGGGAGGS